jgi:hypothetical protein
MEILLYLLKIVPLVVGFFVGFFVVQIFLSFFGYEYIVEIRKKNPK